MTGQNLQRIRGLNSADYRSHRGQHTSGLTSRLRAGGWLRVYATQTRSAARNHRHADSVTAYGSSINPGDIPAHSVVVYQISSLKIVGAVQNQIGAGQQILSIRGSKIRHHRFNGAAAV